MPVRANQVFRVSREAWIKVLAAILGLTLAFGAAVFSSVARQQGNVLASALLASAALLMAGFVGITTVPYLARRVAMERVSDVFHYEVTKAGLVYLALTLVVAVAALNTGNNLLFVVVSVMLAAVVISGVMSAAVLRSLELDLSLPEHVFANRSFVAGVSLHNWRRVLPAFSVAVIAPPVARRRRIRLVRTTFRVPRSAKRGQWLTMPDWKVRLEERDKPAPQILSQPVYFPFIPAGATASADVELSFPRRGRYSQESFAISTRFPFSFLEKSRRIALERELIVYPSVDPTDESLEVLPMITGEFESFVRGRGYDLYRIRELLPEDPARFVDWKATARTGALKVREFTREDQRKLRLVFDNPAEGDLAPDAYESAINLMAAIAWHFVTENAQLSFAAPGYAGSPDVHAFLGYLATVNPDSAPSFIESLPVTEDFNVIVTARRRGTIPTSIWASSYIVFMGEMRS